MENTSCDQFLCCLFYPNLTTSLWVRTLYRYFCWRGFKSGQDGRFPHFPLGGVHSSFCFKKVLHVLSLCLRCIRKLFLVSGWDSSHRFPCGIRWIRVLISEKYVWLLPTAILMFSADFLTPFYEPRLWHFPWPFRLAVFTRRRRQVFLLCPIIERCLVDISRNRKGLGKKPNS